MQCIDLNSNGISFFHAGTAGGMEDRDLGRIVGPAVREQAHGVAVPHLEEKHMAWKKPVIKDIACGMEINMYGPSEDDPRPDHPF